MKKRDMKIIKGKKYVEYKEPFFKSIYIAFLLCALWSSIALFMGGWLLIPHFLLLFFFICLARGIYDKEIKRAREDERIKLKGKKK